MIKSKIDENQVKRSIIDYLVLTGWLVLRINSGAYAGEHTDKQGQTRKRFLRFVKWFAGGIEDKDGKAGVSDILALHPSGPNGQPVILAVETKRPGKAANVSEAQKRFLAQWADHGGVWLVAEDVEDVILGLSQ